MSERKREYQREYDKRTNYAAQIKYKKENIKRIPLDVQNEEYEQIKKHIEKTNETVNGFIKRAIRETMLRDNYVEII